MPPSGSRLDVVFRKYDGTLHWHYPMVVLGEDDHGLWLGAPEGTPLRRGAEAPKPARGGFITLVGAGAWSMPIWNAAGSHRFASYVDICMDVRVAVDRVDAVDLDLDVATTWDGDLAVLDEDEFALHRTRYGYPPEVVARAREEVAAVVNAIDQRIEPYATVAARWLAQAGANG
ncbi:MAG TPA: DUF402 domain-containing protein [Acidimicrobiia bacterium]|nr:DUF402 domain-containing protein [Acidimicrobiia bacterium]